MKTVFKVLVLVGTIAGLSEGAGLLVDGPLNASVGGTVMFKTNLITTEEPFLSVVWNFNGIRQIISSLPTANITGPEYEGRISLFRNTGSLELRNLEDSDSGEYRVTISIAGEQLQGSTKLDIYEPISRVTVVPESVDLIEFNSPVNLSCSSSGSSLSFVWKNGTSEVTASDSVLITDGGSTLTFLNVSRYDHGTYWCHVSNPVSEEISDPVSVFISYGPENLQLKASPLREYYEEGLNVHLTCLAESRPLAEIQWFLNGVPLNETGSELRLMNIQVNRSGNYSCHVFNSNTLKIQTSALAVPVLAGVSNVSVESNCEDCVEFTSSVSLFCSASGFSPYFLWMNSSSEVTVGDRVEITDGGSTLTILNVSRSDLDLLRCYVYNYFSEAFSERVNIAINYGPEEVLVKTSPSYGNVIEGSDILLSCSADSRPAASFEWFFNENQILHFGSELNIVNAGMNDEGEYSCRAFNNKTSRYQTSPPMYINVEENPYRGLSSGAITGIVLGCVIFVAVVATGAFLIAQRMKKVQPKQDSVNTRHEHEYETVVFDGRPQNQHLPVPSR